SAKHAHPRPAVTAVPSVHFDDRRVGPAGFVLLRHARGSEPMLLESDSLGGDPFAETLSERAPRVLSETLAVNRKEQRFLVRPAELGPPAEIVEYRASRRWIHGNDAHA